MSKKIILATDAWYPQRNGVVKCVEEMKKHLEKRGFNVLLIHPGLFFSVALFFYPEIKFSLFCYPKIKKIFKKENPDYVHIFTEGPIGLSVRSVCFKSGLKFTTSCHTNFQEYTKYYFWMKIPLLLEYLYIFLKRFCADVNKDVAGFIYLRWFHNKSNGTMAITKELVEKFEAHGFLHMLLWPLGVDTNLFLRNENSPVKEQYNLKSPVFIYFGRIAPEKNVEEFLKLDLPGSKLVVGDGPSKKSLEEKYGKTNIFTGYKKGPELVDFLSVADVLVHPSLTDTFPLAIIEAFSCGLPVAAHDVMDLKHLVKKDVGVLDKDLKKAALECLKISREECRKYALTFSWQESANHFINNLVKSR